MTKDSLASVVAAGALLNHAEELDVALTRLRGQLRELDQEIREAAPRATNTGDREAITRWADTLRDLHATLTPQTDS